MANKDEPLPTNPRPLSIPSLVDPLALPSHLNDHRLIVDILDTLNQVSALVVLPDAVNENEPVPYVPEDPSSPSGPSSGRPGK